jgi:elongation factor Ts
LVNKKILEDIKMAITAAQVKELREKSGAGVMDAKKALVETDGDMEKAIELLREKGMAKAAKKADRVAAEGLTGTYVDGNVAAVVEVNAETDFVAQNAQFVELVKETAKAIAEQKPANNEEALKVTLASGDTLEAAYVNATATIGEKISFRRFALIEKTDEQHFGAYQHNGGRIGVITVLEGGDEALAKQVSMHVAAMKPTVLSYKELDEQFIHDELAQMNHAIDLDNESRAMVNKPALPHLKFGSKSQLTDEIIAQAEEDIKAELKAEGKPEKIWDKIIPGKMARFMLDNTKVDQQYTLLAQVYIMDDSKTVEQYLDSVNAKVVTFARFEVGEGIEKAANDFESEVAATMAAALNK